MNKSSEVIDAKAENVQVTQEEYVEKFLVLTNHEEQHSLWPSYKPIPTGWKKVFDENIKEKCLEYVEENWTDMRPLSLREEMEMLQRENEAKKIKSTATAKSQ